MPNYEIHVVLVEREPGVWVAQCLQYDLGAQAANLPDLLYQLQRCLVGHVTVAVENGREPFVGLSPAPDEYWQLWNESDRSELEPANVLPFSLPRPVAVPVPRYRVASAAVAA